MSVSSTPILELPSGVVIKTMTATASGVFLGLADGRILRLDAIYSNAYLTGARSLFAQIQNIMGQTSDIGWSNLMYRLSNYILKLDNQILVKAYPTKLPLAATQFSEVVGAFTTPILWGGSDFGYWDQLNYNQIVPSNTQVIVGVRVGRTAEMVSQSDWVYFDGTPTSISLDRFNTQGSYIQATVILKTTVANLTPYVSSLTLSYQTKYAVYLFTRKFSLDSQTNLKSGLITANVITPPHTEVRFGISGKDSKEWNDYLPVELDKSFELPSTITDQFKVGIKLMTSSLSASATVDSFALMLSGDVDNEINKVII